MCQVDPCGATVPPALRSRSQALLGHFGWWPQPSPKRRRRSRSWQWHGVRSHGSDPMGPMVQLSPVSPVLSDVRMPGDTGRAGPEGWKVLEEWWKDMESTSCGCLELWMQWRDVGPALILHHAHSLWKPRQKRCGLCWAHTIRHYKFLPYPNNPVPFACIRELNGTASAVPAACMGLLDMSHAARVATSIANKRNISTSYNILLMCTYAHWYLCLRCTLHVKTLRALHPGGAPDILWFSAWLKIGSIQITKELSVTAVTITSKWHKMWLPLPCLALQLIQMALQGLSMLLGIAYHDLMLDSTCPMVWQTQCTATQQNHLEGLPTATSF